MRRNHRGGSRRDRAHARRVRHEVVPEDSRRTPLKRPLPRLALAAALLLPFGGCATPGAPRSYFHQDSQARYYADDAGRTLRVEKDGTVLDITCVSLEAAEDKPRAQIPTTFCGGADVPVLGKAARAEGDWDMAPYGVLPETGRCKPLFGGVTMDARENERRRSCWNRLWEVPTAVVVVPIAAGAILAGATAPIWVPLVLLH